MAEDTKKRMTIQLQSGTVQTTNVFVFRIKEPNNELGLDLKKPNLPPQYIETFREHSVKDGRRGGAHGYPERDNSQNPLRMQLS